MSKIESLKSPLLVIHGDRDEIIPLRLAQGLFEKAREPKEFFLIEGGGHNDLLYIGGRKYYDRVHTFLARVDGDDDPIDEEVNASDRVDEGR